MGETDCGGEAMLSKSLIQLSVNGWSCVPSLLFQFSSVTQSCPLRPHRLQQATTPCPSSIPSLLKLMPIELVMPSNHFILYHPFLLPSNFPSIRIFSNESALRIRWPSGIGVSASTSVFPMNTQDWSPLEWTGWISLQSKGLLRVFSNTTVQKHPFFCAQLPIKSNSHIHRWLLEKP